MQRLRDERLEKEMHDFLEDSLSYSPLKDIGNKENSPSLFFSNIERARQSPSTARLFALLGGGASKMEVISSPPDMSLKPKRLQDFLETPKDSLSSSKDLPPDPPRSVNELPSEVKGLRSSLEMIQRDCEFHRQRATAAQDQVDHLNRYIALLEEENRKVGIRRSEVSTAARPTDDAEKLQLRTSLESMEVLNRSLARQNDLLRRRSSVSSRFSSRDARIQTESITGVSVGTDPLVADIKDLESLPFLPTPNKSVLTPAHLATPNSRVISRIYVRDSESQTEKGIWASVEGMNPHIPPPVYSSLPDISAGLTLPIPKRSGYPSNTELRAARRSLPSTYPLSPFSNPVGAASVKSLVPKPLLAPPRRPVRSAYESSSVFHSRKDWKSSTSQRGKSTGAVSRPRPRWIP